MDITTDKYQSRLERIQDNILTAEEYFRDPVKRYHKSRVFTFKNSIGMTERTILTQLKKPIVQVNIGEAFISRLRGEFAKQEPSFKVSSSTTALNPVDPEMIKLVEGHTRAITQEANKEGFSWDVYNEQMSGGYSVMKVYTDYTSPMSFEQNIYLRKAFDPTLCGFDPTAQLRHKGDGNFCFEIEPMTEETFKRNYSNIDISQLKFSPSADLKEFNWSYKTDRTKIILVARYYEKEYKKVKIAWLADGSVTRSDEYEDAKNKWIADGHIEQYPSIIQERQTMTYEIVRYLVIENKVIDYKKTDYTELPLIFVDGNSQILRNMSKGQAYQFTRPYTYQLRDIQRIKNASAQTLVNELETMIQHKIAVAKESIPAGEEEVYKNVQLAAVMTYNAFKDNNPQIPLPPPTFIQRPPMPPEIMQTFRLCDEAAQAVLGNYDAALGINNNELSGKAIIEGATQSNATAMPYVVNFMLALNQAGKIILGLIPKYYKTPRTIPVIDVNGKRQYAKINQNGGMKIDYDPFDLTVDVEAGVNFEIQKNQALQLITQLSQAMPVFGNFMNTAGLPTLLDNISIRGIEGLKELAEKFSDNQQIQQQQQQQIQQQMQMMQQKLQATMMQNRSLEMQAKASKLQNDISVDNARIENERQSLLNETYALIADIQATKDESKLQLLKAHTERFSKMVELDISRHAQYTNHIKEINTMLDKLNEPSIDNSNQITKND